LEKQKMIKRTTNYNSKTRKNKAVHSGSNAPKAFKSLKSTPKARKPIVDVPEKVAKVRRRNGSPILFYVLLSTIGVAIFTVLSLTVLFRAGEIIVDGASPYSNAAIIEAANLKVGDNIFLANVNSEAVSSALPHIRNIQISRRIFPSKIILTVEKARCTYKIAHENSYVILDDRLQVLRILNAEDVEDFEGITLTGTNIENPIPGEIAKFVNEDSRYALTYLARNLQETNFTGVGIIDIEDAANINMVFDNRILLSLGTLAEISYKLEFANEIITNELPVGVTGRLDLTRLSLGGNTVHFSRGDIEDFIRGDNETSTNTQEHYAEGEFYYDENLDENRESA